MIVTVDFDSTLSREDVQEYVKELISKGIEVWIVTSRYDDLHSYRYPLNPQNKEVYEIAKKVGIPLHNIRFTLMEDKSKYLYMTKAIWHLDDDIIEINNMLYDQCKTVGIHIEEENWKEKCNSLLNF
jgi:hypothetical protein